MFGLIKKQKVDQKVLTFAVDSAFDNWMQAEDVDALLAETGKTRQQLLDAVMADDEVISCREDIEGAISAAPWRIWGDGVDEQVINRLYKIVRRLLPDFIQLAILAKLNGYAVAEYIYKKDPDGFLTLDKVASKDGELDKYTPRRDGSVLFAIEDGSIEINQAVKYLVLTNKAVPARPAGELLVIRAYPAVALRKREWAYAGQFIARYAQPYVVGKQGSEVYGDPESKLSRFTSKIFGFINGGAAGIGKDDSIEMHQLSGDGSAFELFERLANRRIQKLLLGRVKTSELTAGSRSAQETDDEARQDRISTYLALMAKGIQHAIDAIIEVNKYYGMAINAPQGIWFEYPKPKTFNLLEAEVDVKYTSTGQVKLTKQRLLNVGYEESEFEMINDSSNNAQVLPLSHTCHNCNEHYQLSTPLPASPLNAKDRGEESSSDAGITKKEQQLMQPKIAALLSSCDDCDSYAEFEKRLSELELPDTGLVADLANNLAESFVNGLTADKSAKD